MTGEIGVERRAFDQRADPAQHITGCRWHRATEQFDGARVRRHQAEQQPDRGRLPRTVRTEEPIDRTTRHREVDGVDGDVRAEPASEAVRRDGERRVDLGRLQRRGDRGHKPCPLDATFSMFAGLTGSDVERAVVRDEDRQQGGRDQLAAGNLCRDVIEWRAAPERDLRSTRRLRPREGADPPDGSGPFDDSAAFAGNAGTALVILSTSVQPLPSSVVFRSGVTVTGFAGVTRVPGGAPSPPVTLVRTTKAPSPNGPLLRVSPNGAVSCSTFAPAGGTNSKIDELGTLKLTLVNPTWNAGLLAPAAKICKRSGTDVAASIAICTLPMSERAVLGRELQLVRGTTGNSGGAIDNDRSRRVDRGKRLLSRSLRVERAQRWRSRSRPGRTRPGVNVLCVTVRVAGVVAPQVGAVVNEVVFGQLPEQRESLLVLAGVPHVHRVRARHQRLERQARAATLDTK